MPEAALEKRETIRLLRNGREAFPAWLEAIAHATEEIVLEMYWFAGDATGRLFADALAARARDAIDVYLLYDAVGSLGTDSAIFDEMRRAGVNVIEWNPVAPWSARFAWAHIGKRDHRKILVVDSHVGFTGGINICDADAPREDGGENWRDDAVRVTGPAAIELRALFFDTWMRAGGPRPQRREAERRRRRQLNAAAKAQAGGTVAPPPRFGRSETSLVPSRQLYPPTIQVFGHATWGAQRTIRNLYVRHIRSATRCVLISNSYFVPDNIVRHELMSAARRGVEVRVLIPRASDVRSVAFASRALYTRFMRAGVHIHEWVEGMLHAKTAVIDDWATVGSYNLDYRSLRYNLEANVASRQEDFVSSVEASIRQDLARAETVDPISWSKRGWLERLLEWINYLLRKVL